jgi:hypothetical protein
MTSADQQPQAVLTGVQPSGPAAPQAAAAAVPGIKVANITAGKSSTTGNPAAQAGSTPSQSGSSEKWKSSSKPDSKGSNSSSSNSKAGSLQPGQASAGQGNSTAAGKQWSSSGKNGTLAKGSNSTANKFWSSSKKLGSYGGKGNSTGAWKFSGKSGGAVKVNGTAAAVPIKADKTTAGNTTSAKPAAASSPAAAGAAAADGGSNAAVQQQASAPAVTSASMSNSSSTGAAAAAAPTLAVADYTAVMLQAVDGTMLAHNLSAVATAGVAAMPASADSFVEVISTIADIVKTVADMVNSNATAPPTAAANFTAAGSSSSGGSSSSTVLVGNQTSAVFNESVTADIVIETAAVCKPPAYQAPPRGTPPPPLDIRRGQLVNRLNGRPVTIRGINWFGFNVDMGMVDGLWAGGSDAATDFNKIAYQIRMLGFNAVRLPFAHRFLNKTDVWNLVRECKPVTGVQLKDRLIAPEDANQIALRRTLPPHPAPMRNAPGKCNTYLPTRNNQDRLLFAVQQFVALGMYVVLDYQPQGLEQHAYDLVDFVTYWGNLWRRVTCLPNFNSDLANRVLVDVMNEPDSMGIRWEASGDRPGAEQLYLATADALWNISPDKVLFMFEGEGAVPAMRRMPKKHMKSMQIHC